VYKDIVKKANWFRKEEVEYYAQVEWRTEDGTPIRRRKYELSHPYENHAFLSVLAD